MLNVYQTDIFFIIFIFIVLFVYDKNSVVFFMNTLMGKLILLTSLLCVCQHNLNYGLYDAFLNISTNASNPQSYLIELLSDVNSLLGDLNSDEVLFDNIF